MNILIIIMGSVSFIDKVFKISKKRPLVEADLGKSSAAVKPKTLYQKFMVGWNKELEKPADKRSLLKALVGATGKCQWIFAIFLTIVTVVLTFIPTLILNILVRDLEGTSPLSILLYYVMV